MARIIWDGNKNWENVWDGKQPWDRECEEKSIPENAVLIDRPDDIIKASIPYMIIPCIVCFVAIFAKKAPLFFHSRHWKNFCISSGERRTFQFHSSASRKSRILRCLIPSRLISSSSIVTTYFGKLSRTPANAPNSRWMVSSEASR